MQLRNLRKIIAAWTVLCFAFTQLVWADPQGSVHLPRPSEVQWTRSAAPLLPPELGYVKEIWGARPSLILLEDAHGQMHGQERIRGILDFLFLRGGIRTLFLEGAIGRLDRSPLHFFADETRNREAHRRLLEAGEIGGPELFLLDQNAEGIGVEDPLFYVSDIKSFQKVFSQKAESDRYLSRLERGLLEAVQRDFSPSLRRFFTAWFRYHNDLSAGNLDLFLNLMRRLALEDLRWDLRDPRSQIQWPMLVRYFELQSREPGLDAMRAEQESNRLSQWAQKAGLSVPKASPYADLRTHWEDFYEKASLKGFRFEDYPHFSLKEGYEILQRELDGEELVLEIERLSEQIFDRLAPGSRGRKILEEGRRYLTLKNLFSCALERDEFLKLIREGIPLRPDAPTSIKAIYRDALHFYSLAIRREDAMLQRVLATMGSARTEPAVLVAGGFHTRGLTDQLRARRVSYMVVRPRLEAVEERARYLDAMMGRTPARSHARVASWMSDWGELLRRELPTIARRRDTLRHAISMAASEARHPIVGGQADPSSKLWDAERLFRSEARFDPAEALDHPGWLRLTREWKEGAKDATWRTRAPARQMLLWTSPEKLEEFAALRGYPSFMGYLAAVAKMEEKRWRKENQLLDDHLREEGRFFDHRNYSDFFRHVKQSYWFYLELRKWLRANKGRRGTIPLVIDLVGPGLFQEPLTLLALIRSAYEAEEVTLKRFPLRFNIFDRDERVFRLFQQGRIVYPDLTIKRAIRDFESQLPNGVKHLRTADNSIEDADYEAIERHTRPFLKEDWPVIRRHFLSLFEPVTKPGAKTVMVGIETKWKGWEPWFQAIRPRRHIEKAKLHHRSRAVFANYVFSHIPEARLGNVLKALQGRLQAGGFLVARHHQDFRADLNRYFHPYYSRLAIFTPKGFRDTLPEPEREEVKIAGGRGFLGLDHILVSPGIYPADQTGEVHAGDLAQSINFGWEGVRTFLARRQAVLLQKDRVRALVVGSGAGIDSLFAIYQLFHEYKISSVELDLIDVNPHAVLDSARNVEALLKALGIEYRTTDSHHGVVFDLGRRGRIQVLLVRPGREVADLAKAHGRGRPRRYDYIFFNAPQVWEGRDRDIQDIEAYFGSPSIVMGKREFRDLVSRFPSLLTKKGEAVLEVDGQGLKILKGLKSFEIRNVDVQGLFKGKAERILVELRRRSEARGKALEEIAKGVRRSYKRLTDDPKKLPASQHPLYKRLFKKIPPRKVLEEGLAEIPRYVRDLARLLGEERFLGAYSKTVRSGKRQAQGFVDFIASLALVINRWERPLRQRVQKPHFSILVRHILRERTLANAMRLYFDEVMGRGPKAWRLILDPLFYEVLHHHTPHFHRALRTLSGMARYGERKGKLYSKRTLNHQFQKRIRIGVRVEVSRIRRSLLKILRSDAALSRILSTLPSIPLLPPRRAARKFLGLESVDPDRDPSTRFVVKTQKPLILLRGAGAPHGGFIYQLTGNAPGLGLSPDPVRIPAGLYSHAARTGGSKGSAAIQASGGRLQRLMNQWGTLDSVLFDAASGGDRAEALGGTPWITFSRSIDEVLAEFVSGGGLYVIEVPPGEYVLDEFVGAEARVLVPHFVPSSWVKAVITNDQPRYERAKVLRRFGIKVYFVKKFDRASVLPILRKLGIREEDFAFPGQGREHALLLDLKRLDPGLGGWAQVFASQTLRRAIEGFPYLAHLIFREPGRWGFFTEGGREIGLDDTLQDGMKLFLRDKSRLLSEARARSKASAYKARITRAARQSGFLLDFEARLSDREILRHSRTLDRLVQAFRRFPRGILAKRASFIELWIHPDLFFAGGSVPTERGPVLLGLKQLEEARWGVDHILAHELLHKLSVSRARDRDDLIFPIQDWIDFLEINGFRKVERNGQRIPIRDLLSVEIHGFELVADRIRNLNVSDFYRPDLQLKVPKALRSQRGYLSQPAEFLAWIGTGLGKSRGYQKVKESLEIFERNFLRAGEKIYRFRHGKGWLVKRLANSEARTARGKTEDPSSGELLSLIGMTRNQVFQKLDSPEINWNFREFHRWLETDELRDRDIELYRFPVVGVLNWLAQLGILDHPRLKKRVIEIFQEHMGHARASAASLGIHFLSFRRLFRHLGLDDRKLRRELPAGTLLRSLARVWGLSAAQAKRQILSMLEHARWNLWKLRKILAREHGHSFIANTHFSYAELLWGLDLGKEFIAEYDLRHKNHLGDRKAIQRSFGMGGKADALTRVFNRLGIKRGGQKPVDLLEDALRMGPDEILRELERKHDWNLRSFVNARGRAANLGRIQKRAGMIGVVRRLGIVEPLREKVIERWIAYYGFQGVVARSFGVHSGRFPEFAKALGIDLAAIDIPRGNLLTAFYPGKKPERMKGEVRRTLEASGWNLPRLKLEFLGSHPHLKVLKDAHWISYADLIRGLDLVDEFLSQYQKMWSRPGAGWNQVGRAFGFSHGKQEILQLLRELGLSTSKARRKKARKIYEAYAGLSAGELHSRSVNLAARLGDEEDVFDLFSSLPIPRGVEAALAFQGLFKAFVSNDREGARHYLFKHSIQGKPLVRYLSYDGSLRFREALQTARQNRNAREAFLIGLIRLEREFSPKRKSEARADKGDLIQRVTTAYENLIGDHTLPPKSAHPLRRKISGKYRYSKVIRRGERHIGRYLEDIERLFEKGLFAEAYRRARQVGGEKGAESFALTLARFFRDLALWEHRFREEKALRKPFTALVDRLIREKPLLGPLRRLFQEFALKNPSSFEKIFDPVLYEVLHRLGRHIAYGYIELPGYPEGVRPWGTFLSYVAVRFEMPRIRRSLLRYYIQDERLKEIVRRIPKTRITPPPQDLIRFLGVRNIRASTDISFRTVVKTKRPLVILRGSGDEGLSWILGAGDRDAFVRPDRNFPGGLHSLAGKKSYGDGEGSRDPQSYSRARLAGIFAAKKTLKNVLEAAAGGADRPYKTPWIPFSRSLQQIVRHFSARGVIYVVEIPAGEYVADGSHSDEARVLLPHFVPRKHIKGIITSDRDFYAVAQDLARFGIKAVYVPVLNLANVRKALKEIGVAETDLAQGLDWYPDREQVTIKGFHELDPDIPYFLHVLAGQTLRQALKAHPYLFRLLSFEPRRWGFFTAGGREVGWNERLQAGVDLVLRDKAQPLSEARVTGKRFAPINPKLEKRINDKTFLEYVERNFGLISLQGYLESLGIQRRIRGGRAYVSKFVNIAQLQREARLDGRSLIPIVTASQRRRNRLRLILDILEAAAKVGKRLTAKELARAMNMKIRAGLSLDGVFGRSDDRMRTRQFLKDVNHNQAVLRRPLIVIVKELERARQGRQQRVIRAMEALDGLASAEELAAQLGLKGKNKNVRHTKAHTLFHEIDWETVNRRRFEDGLFPIFPALIPNRRKQAWNRVIRALEKLEEDLEEGGRLPTISQIAKTVGRSVYPVHHALLLIPWDHVNEVRRHKRLKPLVSPAGKGPRKRRDKNEPQNSLDPINHGFSILHVKAAKNGDGLLKAALVLTDQLEAIAREGGLNDVIRDIAETAYRSFVDAREMHRLIHGIPGQKGVIQEGIDTRAADKVEERLRALSRGYVYGHSEARAGEYRSRLAYEMTEEELIDSLEALGWDWKEFGELHPRLPSVKKVGTVALATGLGSAVREAYREHVIHTYRENFGLEHIASAVLRMNETTFRKAVSQLGILLDSYPPYPGTLLKRLRLKGETEKKTKARLLQGLGDHWVSQLRHRLSRQIQDSRLRKAVKSLSNGVLLWVLDLADEFIVADRAMVKKFGANDSKIGAAFGWKGNSAAANLRRVRSEIKRLRWEVVLRSRDVTTTEVLGGPEKIVAELRGQYDWDLYAYVEAHRQLLRPIVQRRGWAGLIRELHIVPRFRDILRRRYIAFHGDLSAMMRSFGMKEKLERFREMVEAVYPELRSLKIPPGNLLRTYRPDQTVYQTRSQILRRLRASKWSDFARLKREFFGNHPYLTERSLSQADFIRGLNLVEPFVKKVIERAHDPQVGPDLGAIAESLGWPKAHAKRDLAEVLQKLAPELLDEQGRFAFPRASLRKLQRAQAGELLKPLRYLIRTHTPRYGEIRHKAVVIRPTDGLLAQGLSEDLKAVTVLESRPKAFRRLARAKGRSFKIMKRGLRNYQPKVKPDILVADHTLDPLGPQEAAKAIAQMSRALRGDGHLLLMVNDPDSIDDSRNRIGRWLQESGSLADGLPPLAGTSLRNLELILQQTGFEFHRVRVRIYITSKSIEPILDVLRFLIPSRSGLSDAQLRAAIQARLMAGPGYTLVLEQIVISARRESRGPIDELARLLSRFSEGERSQLLQPLMIKSKAGRIALAVRKKALRRALSRLPTYEKLPPQDQKRIADLVKRVGISKVREILVGLGERPAPRQVSTTDIGGMRDETEELYKVHIDAEHLTRSEARTITRRHPKRNAKAGDLVARLKMTSDQIIRKLNSREIDWNFRKLHEYLAGRAMRRGNFELAPLYAMDIAHFLKTLGIWEDARLKQAIRERLEERMGLRNVAAASHGITAPSYGRLLAQLGIDYRAVRRKLRSGTLLAGLARHWRRKPEQVKRKLLRELTHPKEGKSWNLARLKKVLAKELPFSFVRATLFSYAELIWGLDLVDEFYAEYLRRYDQYLGNPLQVQLSFGISTGDKRTLEKTLARLTQWSGKPMRHMEKEVDLKEDALGMGFDQIVDELETRHDWNLKSFMAVGERKKTFAVMMNKGGYLAVIRRLGLAGIFAEKIAERWVAYNGFLYAVAESFGLRLSGFRETAAALGVDLTRIPIPAGSLLKAFYPRLSSGKAKARVLKVLRSHNWNLREVKKELFASHPHLGNLSASSKITYTEILRGLGVVEEFLAEYQNRRVRWGNNWTKIGESFGFPHAKEQLFKALEGVGLGATVLAKEKAARAYREYQEKSDEWLRNRSNNLWLGSDRLGEPEDLYDAITATGVPAGYEAAMAFRGLFLALRSGDGTGFRHYLSKHPIEGKPLLRYLTRSIFDQLSEAWQSARRNRRAREFLEISLVRLERHFSPRSEARAGETRFVAPMAKEAKALLEKKLKNPGTRALRKTLLQRFEEDLFRPVKKYFGGRETPEFLEIKALAHAIVDELTLLGGLRKFIKERKDWIEKLLDQTPRKMIGSLQVELRFQRAWTLSPFSRKELAALISEVIFEKGFSRLRLINLSREVLRDYFLKRYPSRARMVHFLRSLVDAGPSLLEKKAPIIWEEHEISKLMRKLIPALEREAYKKTNAYLRLEEIEFTDPKARFLQGMLGAMWEAGMHQGTKGVLSIAGRNQEKFGKVAAMGRRLHQTERDEELGKWLALLHLGLIIDAFEGLGEGIIGGVYGAVESVTSLVEERPKALRAYLKEMQKRALSPRALKDLLPWLPVGIRAVSRPLTEKDFLAIISFRGERHFSFLKGRRSSLILIHNGARISARDAAFQEILEAGVMGLEAFSLPGNVEGHSHPMGTDAEFSHDDLLHRKQYLIELDRLNRKRGTHRVGNTEFVVALNADHVLELSYFDRGSGRPSHILRGQAAMEWLRKAGLIRSEARGKRKVPAGINLKGFHATLQKALTEAFRCMLAKGLPIDRASIAKMDRFKFGEAIGVQEAILDYHSRGALMLVDRKLWAEIARYRRRPRPDARKVVKRLARNKTITGPGPYYIKDQLLEDEAFPPSRYRYTHANFYHEYLEDYMDQNQILDVLYSRILRHGHFMVLYGELLFARVLGGEVLENAIRKRRGIDLENAEDLIKLPIVPDRLENEGFDKSHFLRLRRELKWLFRYARSEGFRQRARRLWKAAARAALGRSEARSQADPLTEQMALEIQQADRREAISLMGEILANVFDFVRTYKLPQVLKDAMKAARERFSDSPEVALLEEMTRLPRRGGKRYFEWLARLREEYAVPILRNYLQLSTKVLIDSDLRRGNLIPLLTALLLSHPLVTGSLPGTALQEGMHRLKKMKVDHIFHRIFARAKAAHLPATTVANMEFKFNWTMLFQFERWQLASAMAEEIEHNVFTYGLDWGRVKKGHMELAIDEFVAAIGTLATLKRLLPDREFVKKELRWRFRRLRFLGPLARNMAGLAEPAKKYVIFDNGWKIHESHTTAYVALRDLIRYFRFREQKNPWGKLQQLLYRKLTQPYWKNMDLEEWAIPPFFRKFTHALVREAVRRGLLILRKRKRQYPKYEAFLDFGIKENLLTYPNLPALAATLASKAETRTAAEPGVPNEATAVLRKDYERHELEWYLMRAPRVVANTIGEKSEHGALGVIVDVAAVIFEKGVAFKLPPIVAEAIQTARKHFRSPAIAFIEGIIRLQYQSGKKYFRALDRLRETYAKQVLEARWKDRREELYSWDLAGASLVPSLAALFLFHPLVSGIASGAPLTGGVSRLTRKSIQTILSRIVRMTKAVDLGKGSIANSDFEFSVSLFKDQMHRQYELLNIMIHEIEHNVLSYGLGYRAYDEDKEAEGFVELVAEVGTMGLLENLGWKSSIRHELEEKFEKLRFLRPIITRASKIKALDQKIEFIGAKAGDIQEGHKSAALVLRDLVAYFKFQAKQRWSAMQILLYRILSNRDFRRQAQLHAATSSSAQILPELVKEWIGRAVREGILVPKEKTKRPSYEAFLSLGIANKKLILPNIPELAANLAAKAEVRVPNKSAYTLGELLRDMVETEYRRQWTNQREDILPGLEALLRLGLVRRHVYGRNKSKAEYYPDELVERLTPKWRQKLYALPELQLKAAQLKKGKPLQGHRKEIVAILKHALAERRILRGLKKVRFGPRTKVGDRVITRTVRPFSATALDHVFSVAELGFDGEHLLIDRSLYVPEGVRQAIRKLQRQGFVRNVKFGGTIVPLPNDPYVHRMDFEYVNTSGKRTHHTILVFLEGIPGLRLELPAPEVPRGRILEKTFWYHYLRNRPVDLFVAHDWISPDVAFALEWVRQSGSLGPQSLAVIRMDEIDDGYSLMHRFVEPIARRIRKKDPEASAIYGDLIGKKAQRKIRMRHYLNRLFVKFERFLEKGGSHGFDYDFQIMRDVFKDDPVLQPFLQRLLERIHDLRASGGEDRAKKAAGLKTFVRQGRKRLRAELKGRSELRAAVATESKVEIARALTNGIYRVGERPPIQEEVRLSLSAEEKRWLADEMVRALNEGGRIVMPADLLALVPRDVRRQYLALFLGSLREESRGARPIEIHLAGSGAQELKASFYAGDLEGMDAISRSRASAFRIHLLDEQILANQLYGHSRELAVGLLEEGPHGGLNPGIAAFLLRRSEFAKLNPGEQLRYLVHLTGVLLFASRLEAEEIHKLLETLSVRAPKGGHPRLSSETLLSAELAAVWREFAKAA